MAMRWGRQWHLCTGFKQLVHVFNVRSNKFSIFKLGFIRGMYWELLQFRHCFRFQLLVPFLANIFKVVSLGAKNWGWVLLLTLTPIVIVEIVKALGYNIAKDEE